MANLTEHTYIDLSVNNQLTIAKVLAMVVLGLGSFMLGLAPLKMTNCWRKKSFSPSIDGDHHQHHHHHHHQHHHSHPGDSASDSPMVSRLLCFGGGVLLSTTLLHLQPEVREVVSRLQHAELLPETENLGDLLFCAGFFMVFLVDEMAHTVLDLFYASGRRARCPDESVRRQSMSLRGRSWSVSSQIEPTSFNGCSDQENEAQKEEKEESSSREQQERYRQHHRSYQYSMQFHPNGGSVEKQQQQYVVFETGSSDNDNSLRGLFTVLALSFHEVFEGMAIGLEERVDHVWYLFIAVATHKLVIAFCIGLELAWSGTRRFVLIVYVATFAVVTPIGIAFGMAIVRYGGTVGSKDGSPGPVAAVLQGLAAGTLLYVVFFEVLARHKQSGWAHLLSIMLGFGVLLALQMLTHHQHGHGGHNHGDLGHSRIYSHAHNHEHGKDHDHSLPGF